MKSTLFLIFIFILVPSVQGQKKLSEVNLQVNGVGEGTSYSTVRRHIIC